MSTLLANIKNVCLELGLPTPNSVVSSTDQTTLQLLALINRVGDLLSTERDWNALAAEWRFQTVFYTLTGTLTAGSNTITGLASTAGLSADFMAGGVGINTDSQLTSVGTTSVVLSQPATVSGTVAITFGQVRYPLPADFARMVDKTQYNKANRWALLGPNDAQQWQWLKSGWAANGPRTRFRLMAGKFCIWPMPTSVATLGCEYVSNGWVISAAGSVQSSFLADTDLSIFPDRLLVMGAKLKFFELKGFNTTALLNDFTRELDKYKAAEAGSDTLSLAPRAFDPLLTTNNLPDTGYGG